MLIYYIDAFNLIHKIEPVLDSPSPHSALVNFLMAKRLSGSATNRVVVVFDGFEPKGQLFESPYEIVFSNLKTADDVIKDRVSRAANKRQIVVVSDDRSVREHARGEGAEVMHTEEFLRMGRGNKKVSTKDKDDEKKMSEEEREKLMRELGEKWGK